EMKGAIAIVGGSIGGATAAIEFARAGFDVEVFERSAGNLMDRGAGIGVSVLLLDKMEQRDLIDPGTPSFRVSKRRFVVRSGYCLWRGFLDERLVPDVSLFDDALTFSVYRGGHGPLYFVPSRDGDVESGRRRLNWGIYAAIPGPPAPVYPGGASRAQIDEVRRLGSEMAGYVQEIVDATED